MILGRPLRLFVSARVTVALLCAVALLLLLNVMLPQAAVLGEEEYGEVLKRSGPIARFFLVDLDAQTADCLKTCLVDKLEAAGYDARGDDGGHRRGTASHRLEQAQRREDLLRPAEQSQGRRQSYRQRPLAADEQRRQVVSSHSLGSASA